MLSNYGTSGVTTKYCNDTSIPSEPSTDTVIILCYKISHHSYDTRVPSERQKDTVMTLASCRFVDLILSLSNLKQLPVADSLNMSVSNRQLNRQPANELPVADLLKL